MMKQAASVDSVALLDRDMAEKNLSGYWRLGMEGLPPQPMTSVRALSMEMGRCARKSAARR